MKKFNETGKREYNPETKKVELQFYSDLITYGVIFTFLFFIIWLLAHFFK